MRITDLIEKKKHGQRLTTDEVRFIIRGYVEGDVADYQMAALLMAIWFAGMDEGETLDLTMAMVESGDRVDLSAIPGIKVDKHSTGGVADTTTLVVAPLVAACGGRVAKMSGRGLGHTGGTLDKLESIPGFSVEVEMDAFVRVVNTCGLSIIGQTADLVPADRKIYALRDVTGTVDNFSLIASSIMSKKLASGADAIVLDVKTGSGAFMREPRDAESLARIMVDIGSRSGRKTVAFVTDMNQPLGLAVGNALEVREAVEILRGERDGDLKELSCVLAAEMLILGGWAENQKSARDAIQAAIETGAALEKLGCMISAQGGDSRVLDDLDLLPSATKVMPVPSKGDGYVERIDTEQIGMSALVLGAGRVKKTDDIDPAVGLWMLKRLGEPVEKGELIAELHVNATEFVDEALRRVGDAITIASTKPDPLPLVYKKLPEENGQP